MITYDRSIRQTIHTTLHAHDAAALAQLGASCRRRDPAPTSRKRRLACVAGIAVALGALIAPSVPVAAQDGATAAAFVYLPAVGEIDRQWFTDAELDATMRRAGYDPEVVSMHTWCELDAAAQPPVLILYANCTQQTDQDGNPSDSMATVYMRTDGAMHWSTMTAATGSDAQ